MRGISTVQWHDGQVTTTSLLDRVIYSYADVDRLNSLTPGTGRRWLEGYERGGVFYEPVLRESATADNYVTWGEMVEARLLAEFRVRRVSLQRLRPAVVLLRHEFNRYPLAHARPFLDVAGRELVRKVQDEVSLARELQFVVVRSNQAMLDIRAERFTDSVTYDDGIAIALRPSDRTPSVAIDPTRSFGQPSVRGVRTEVLAEDYRSGESLDSLADLYELPIEQVEEAIRFELMVGLYWQIGRLILVRQESEG